jgi:hyperosmotically inducible protein
MRVFAMLVTLILLSACTAMVLGNGPSGNSQPSTTSTADSAITARVKDELAADASLSAYSFSVRTYSGSVILGGTVDGHVAREQAGRVTKAISGVKSVTNQIVVE